MKTGDLFDLSGQVALIAGGTRGLGKAVAHRYLEHGATVVVAARDRAVGESARSALQSLVGCAPERVHFMHFDMACTDQCQSLVRRVVAEHGRLDSLVVTAAADHRGGFLDEVTEWEWAYLLRTNLLGLVRLANEACIAIARSGGGSVVLIGSAAGLRGSRGHPAYALTKSTMTQVAQHLAVQWGVSAVRINCIAPSLIRTEFSRTIWADEAKAARALPSYPLGRFGEPDDVAGIAVALAGRAGAWITGQTIVVDGGMMAGVGVENIVEQRESFDVG